MENTSRAYCPDCGPVGVSHAIERWNVRASIFFGSLMRPLEMIAEFLRPVAAFFKPGRLGPSFFWLGAAARLGAIIRKPDEKTTDRARVLWEEAERRGIDMREFRPFGLPRELFFASYKGDTRVFDGLPRPRTASEAAQDWMDDKGIILEKFNKAGVPVPRGSAVKTAKQAEAVLAEIAAQVIIKPAVGSRSRHTYLHITDATELRKAFLKAKEISPHVVVEEELPGFVFRITLIGGQIAGVMRREPPHVMGDGKHTVQELITEENKNPMRQGPVFHHLEVDPGMLASQHLTLASIPSRDKMVVLHPKVSRTFGASNTEIEDAAIHPDNRELFLKIASILDDPLVGVDFIMGDMNRSWKEQKCGVIECNSLPFIDLHHVPLRGPVRNVAAMVWDLVFPIK